MAESENFEDVLKDLVNGKRLSASKMTKLTDIAMKNMENDTQLVSTLYRTHKTLGSSAKISSLYVFDALCRAARHSASKHNLTGDINAPKGNAATFLLKVEGVLDGLVKDMCSLDLVEGKEKMKKILDIWTKANTFPASVLTRLTDIVSNPNKETGKSFTTTTDPRTNHAGGPSSTQKTSTPPSMTAPPPPTDPVAAQQALLALLSSAAIQASAVPAINSNGQTTVNMNTPAPTPTNLQSLSFALQRLAGSNPNISAAADVAPPTPTYSQGSSSQHLPPATANQASRPNFSPRSPPPNNYRESHPDSERYDSRRERYDNYEGSSYRGRGRGDYHPRRGGLRGGYRGRGGGRDDYDSRGGRYGDRDRYRDRDQDDDRGSPSRRRRSRSRSPPASRTRFGGPAPAGRRDAKPYSPPRRPSISSSREQERMDDRIPQRAGEPSKPEKDEFGRDIRDRSPREEDHGTEGKTEDPKSQTEPDLPSGIAPQTSSSSLVVSPSVLSPAFTSTTQPTATILAEAVASTAIGTSDQKKLGLAEFDFSTFDFTQPTSWNGLGEAFQVTNGYAPSQEELMQIVGAAMMQAAASDQYGSQHATGMGQDASQWEQGWEGYGADGGYGDYAAHYQGAWSGQATMTAGGQEQEEIATTAIRDTINGSENASIDPRLTPSQPVGEASNTVGSGGHMQKVGDKWMFVRNTNT